MLLLYTADAKRRNDVVLASVRRHDIASTSVGRPYDVMYSLDIKADSNSSWCKLGFSYSISGLLDITIGLSQDYDSYQNFVKYLTDTTGTKHGLEVVHRLRCMLCSFCVNATNACTGCEFIIQS